MPARRARFLSNLWPIKMKIRHPKVVVTAGPTQEAIDAVRFISNRSSGRMGYAVAEAALAAGCDVTLVTGPVSLAPPTGGRGGTDPRGRLKVVQVVTAREMARAAIPAFRKADMGFYVAAVADFRPRITARGKLKKRDIATGSDGVFTLEMVANPDILWSCGKIKHKGQVLTGFALEARNGAANATAKLIEKNLDFVVLNGPAALNSDRSIVTVIDRDGGRILMRDRKSRIAARLVRLAIEKWRHRPTQH